MKILHDKKLTCKKKSKIQPSNSFLSFFPISLSLFSSLFATAFLFSFFSEDCRLPFFALQGWPNPLSEGKTPILSCPLREETPCVMASITSWKWARVGLCSYQSHCHGMALAWEKRRKSAKPCCHLGKPKRRPT